jgi:hypothetical protein
MRRLLVDEQTGLGGVATHPATAANLVGAKARLMLRR